MSSLTASVWEVYLPYNGLEAWFGRDCPKWRILRHLREFDSPLFEGALQSGKGRLVLAECIVDHGETERRYVLITSVKFELFQNLARVACASRCGICVPQVGFHPRVMHAGWPRRQFELTDSVIHPPHRDERNAKLEVRAGVSRQHPECPA